MSDGQPDYTSRLRDNVTWLTKQNGRTSLESAAFIGGIARNTIRNWFRGIGSPTLSKLCSLGAGLGVDGADLLLPPDELKAKVARVGLRDPAGPHVEWIREQEQIIRDRWAHARP